MGVAAEYKKVRNKSIQMKKIVSHKRENKRLKPFKASNDPLSMDQPCIKG